MGYKIEYYAFNQKPDIKKLNNIQWLNDWWLYEETGTDIWYLVGKNADNDFYLSPPKIKLPNIPDGINELAKKIQSETLCGEYFPNKSIIICLASTCLISCQLDQPVLCLSSDDEDTDGGYIYDNGQLQCASFESSEGSIHINKNLKITTQLYSNGNDLKDDKPRHLFQIANKVANVFFKTKEPWMMPYEPEDIISRKIRRITQKGNTPTLKLNKLLYKKLGNSPPFSEIYDEMASNITSALQTDIILADRESRNFYQEVISNYWLYVYGITDKNFGKKKDDKDFLALQHMLTNISHYLKLLRPKPEFRKKAYDFNSMNRNLRKQWFLITARKNLKSILMIFQQH